MRLVLPALLVSLALPCTSRGQAAVTGELTGRVLGAADRPLIGATVRLQQGTTVLEVRSGDDGRYRVTGLADGSWIFAVQAVGYQRAFGRLAFVGPRMERDFTLERVPTMLDSVRVRGDWSGLRVTVGDAARHTALAGARVRVIVPGYTTVLTDATGRFDLERAAGADVTFLVTHPGFARRLMQARVPARGAAELLVMLDSAGPPINNEMQWADMVQRVRQAPPRAIMLGREELLQTGAKSLKGAIDASPSVAREGMPSIARDACVFIDGVAMPGFPVHGITALDVDFVELYPTGTEHSGTLALRWPPNGVCGDPVFDHEERRDPTFKFQYVVVWTRSGGRRR